MAMHKKKEHMKHEKKKMASGGKAEGNTILSGDPEEFKEAEGKKHGGKVAHKAKGKMPMHRLDKKARGGKIMTPKSPLSGAAPNKMRPGFSENTLDKEDD